MPALQHAYRPAAAVAFAAGLQARGRYGFALEEVAAATGLSPEAAGAQLRRLAPAIVPVYPRAGYYLIVPPEHRLIGAPPAEWWIDGYFRRQGEPYYLGLLTAAAHHGAQPQAQQTIQVITSRARRGIAIGRLRLSFVIKQRLTDTPVITAAGGQAPFQVSAPEATVLDLVRYAERIGGIARVAEIIGEMKPRLTATGLRAALAVPLDTALLQRTGFLLEAQDMPHLARLVTRTLEGRRLQPAPLEPGIGPAETPRNAWKIYGHLPELAGA